MPVIPRKNQKGFTLIELLAVMAIVAVLAGIIATSVSGTGETSRDAQTKQDATTLESSAAEFFGDQEGAEVLVPKTVTVFTVGGIRQVTSTRWPEDYISEAYPAVFFDETLSPAGVTVDSLTFLTETGELASFTVKGLLENYNAIDFTALSDGGYLTTLPDSVKHMSADLYSSYLWLFEKTTAAGGSSEGAARQVVVFKLVSVQKSEFSEMADLTYQQLVGSSFDETATPTPSPSPSPAPTPTPTTLTLTITPMPSPTPIPPLAIVVPNGNQTVEGVADTDTPFNLASSFIKYQQVYPAGEFNDLPGSGLITQIAFRPDGPNGGLFSGVQIANIDVRLATIPFSPGTLSTNLPDNIPGGTMELVYRGSDGPQLFLSSSNAPTGGGTKQFDIVINLETPFLYDTAVGNLVLDIRVPAGTAATTQFDAVSS